MRSALPPFKKYLRLSLLAHVGLIAVLIVAPSLGPKKPLRHEKIVWIRIPKGVGDTIGVGLKKTKNLPKTTIAESKKPLGAPPLQNGPTSKSTKIEPTKEVSPTAMAEPAKKIPKPKPKPRKLSPTEMALARLKKSTTSRAPEAAQIPDKMAEGGVSFGSETGPFVSPNDPIYVLYQARIRKRIMDAWVLPLSFSSGDISYRCQIVVHINSNGKVIQAKLEQRSGHDAFDQSAMRAIYQASPLDIPPEKLKTEAIEEGFLIEFEPEVKKQ